MSGKIQKSSDFNGLSAGHRGRVDVWIREGCMEAISSLLAGVGIKHFEQEYLILGHLGEVVPLVLSSIPAAQ